MPKMSKIERIDLESHKYNCNYRSLLSLKCITSLYGLNFHVFLHPTDKSPICSYSKMLCCKVYDLKQFPYIVFDEICKNMQTPINWLANYRYY